jgi:hypothetical protein
VVCKDQKDATQSGSLRHDWRTRREGEQGAETGRRGRDLSPAKDKSSEGPALVPNKEKAM